MKTVTHKWDEPCPSRIANGPCPGHEAPDDVECVIPEKWRYTLTLALRALIEKCHSEQNGNGCTYALECARALGLDVETVAKYTHLEKKEDDHAK